MERFEFSSWAHDTTVLPPGLSAKYSDLIQVHPECEWVLAGEGVAMRKTDGTYELVGPHTQKNPEKFDHDILVPHTIETLRLPEDPPRDFDGLTAYLADKDSEGIVFHHSDGRRAKIKMRDFGLKR